MRERVGRAALVAALMVSTMVAVPSAGTASTAWQRYHSATAATAAQHGPGATPKEIRALRTTTSRTYVTRRGTFLTRVYARSGASGRGALRERAARPTATIASASSANAARGCTLTSGASANTSSCASSTLSLGYDGTKVARTLLSFDLSAVPRDAEVLYGRLLVYASSRTSGTSTTLDVRRVSRAWDGTATWNRATTATPWTTAGGDLDAAVEDRITTSGTAAGWLQWRPTQLIRDWVYGDRANTGLAIKASSESVNVLLSLRSPTATSNRPYVEVEYVPRVGDLDRYGMDRQRFSDRLSAGVNTANGNLLLGQRDAAFTGTAYNYAFDRYYNSLSALTNLATDLELNYGDGWTGRETALRVLYAGAPVEYIARGGARIPILKRTDGTFQAAGGAPVGLTWSPGTSAITDDTYTVLDYAQGEKLTFNYLGDVISEADGSGHSTAVTGGPQGPTPGPKNFGGQWADTLGRVTLVRDDSTGTGVDRMTDASGGAHVYTHDAFDLTHYSGPGGYATSYEYAGATPGAPLLSRVWDTAGTDVRFTYDGTSRVTRIQNLTGGVNETTDFAYGTQRTVARRSDGTATVYDYDNKLAVRRQVTLSSQVERDDPTGGASLTWSWDRYLDSPDDVTALVSHKVRWRRSGTTTWSAWITVPDADIEIPALVGDVLDLELQSSTASGATTPVMAATVTTAIDEGDPDPTPNSTETDDEVPGETGSGDPLFGQDYWWHREGTNDTYDNSGNLTSSTPVSEDDPSTLGLMAAPSGPLKYCTPGSKSSLVRGDRFAMMRLKRSHVTKSFTNPATAIHFHIQSKLFYQTRTESALVQVTRRLPDARKRETLRVPRPSGTKPPWYSHTTTHIAVGGRVDYLMQLTYLPKAVIRSIEIIPNGRIVHYLNIWSARGTCRAR